MDNKKKNYLMLFLTEKEIYEYINARNKAKEDGINILAIKNYQIVESGNDSLLIYEIESKFDGIKDHILIYDKKGTLEEFVKKYIQNICTYTNKLENISKAPIETYEKLVSDYINLYNYNLFPSNNPSDYVMNNNSFVIKDAMYNTDNINLDEDEFHLERLIQGVIGHNIPKAIINSQTISIIPKIYSNDIIKYLDIIISKLKIALRKYNYSEDDINTAIEYKYLTLLSLINDNTVDDKIIIEHISNYFNKINKNKVRKVVYGYNISK